MSINLSTIVTSSLTGPIGSTGPLGATGFDGASGATGIQGASGATGILLNWVVKTTTYTAVNHDNIVADTSGGAFTITLPASPSSGDEVRFADGANWATNNLTVARNGSTIEGLAEDLVLDITSVLVNLVYDGTTWQVFASLSAPGATGFQGATGVQGIQGASGATGIQGVQGATGIQGDFGATGAAGINGATGAAGINGATGVQGDFGASGATGTPGASGIGATGPSGGPTGATGPTGASGPGGGGLSNITTDTSASTRYITFVDVITGAPTALYANSSFNFVPSTGTLSATVFNSLSDVNFKENIVTIDNALDLVNSLRGVRFTWKDNKHPAIGLIAQEVEVIEPLLVQEIAGNKTVSYSNIVAILIQAIKEQQEQINELKAK